MGRTRWTTLRRGHDSRARFYLTDQDFNIVVWQGSGARRIAELMELEIRAGVLILLAMAVGCSAAQTTPLVPRRPTLPEVSQRRLNRVHADAPELADAILDVRRAAEDAADAENVPLAERLRRLSELTLMAAAEWLARLENAELRATEFASREHSHPELGIRETEIEAAAETRPSAIRRPQTSTANVDPSGMSLAVDADPLSAEGRDDARKDALSELLAELATKLSEIEPDDENRAQLEGIQTRLIDADRARASGDRDLANQLAQEAKQLLEALVGDGRQAVQTDGTPSESLVAEAQRRLPGQANIVGSTVVVRLEAAVQWNQNRWKTRATQAVESLGTVVRAHPRARLSLITSGSPTSEAFGTEKASLQRYLARRLGIESSRIRWMPSSLSIPRGTYLLIHEEAEPQP